MGLRVQKKIRIFSIIYLSFVSLWIACNRDKAAIQSDTSQNVTSDVYRVSDTLIVADSTIAGPDTIEAAESTISEPDTIEAANSWLKLTWDDLTDVEFYKEYYEVKSIYEDTIVKDTFLTPNFGESVKNLEGKTYFISGYVIPLDIESNFYVLSARSFRSCFFCGGAGPETIMELQFKDKPRRYFTDEYISFRGRLKLNVKDIDHLNYILEDVSEHKVLVRSLSDNP